MTMERIDHITDEELMACTECGAVVRNWDVGAHLGFHEELKR